MSFNAWLYTYADPINLTDPSGQVPCDMLPLEDQIDAGCISPPDVRLTYRGEKYTFNDKTYTRKYGGNEVKTLYDKMKGSACGWWNAETDGQLTFDEFNGLWLLHEANRTPRIEPWVAKAAAQRLYVGGFTPPYCPGGVGSCFNGAFNYWAATSEVVHNLIWAYVRNNTAIEQYNYGYQPGFIPRGALAVKIMDDAARLGHDMLYPTTLDRDKNHGPSNWGNNRDWVDDMIAAKPDPKDRVGPERSQIYFNEGDFLVFSVNQYNFWKDFGARVNLP